MLELESVAKKEDKLSRHQISQWGSSQFPSRFGEIAPSRLRLRTSPPPHLRFDFAHLLPGEAISALISHISCGRIRVQRQIYPSRGSAIVCPNSFNLQLYGNVREIWFDGAKGQNAPNMSYYFDEWFAMVKELQSSINIFSYAEPDIRWAGDEWGSNGSTCWSPINRTSLSIGNASTIGFHF